MGAIHRRRGPNVTGVWGLLQPVADGLKLIAKEIVVPGHANSRIFVLAPLIILTLALLSWSVIPFGCFDISENSSIAKFANITICGNLKNNGWFSATSAFDFITELNDISDIHYSLLLLLAISSLTVYGLILAGWASSSKYAFLGALRSAAQMISYEVSISLVVLPVIMMSGSLNLTEIVMVQDATIWYVVPLLPIAIIFFISMIAETNRTPFDLPEAEAELVAGYNVEYSSIIFAMFFLAEYSNAILMSTLMSILFIGGWSCPLWLPLPAAASLALKSVLFFFLLILVRATFPRYRYDQLMDIGWKIFLPITTGFLLLTAGILIVDHSLPIVMELPSNVSNTSFISSVYKAFSC